MLIVIVELHRDVVIQPILRQRVDPEGKPIMDLGPEVHVPEGLLPIEVLLLF